MGIIKINGIHLYAYHGCLEEEAKIGGNYIVDITLETDFFEAASKDDLSKTIDYVIVYDLVKQEMEVRSKLIEHVTGRIIGRLRSAFKTIQKVEVKLTKLNPPIGGEVEGVSVTMVS